MTANPSDTELTKQEIPTAVSVKNVLQLIVSHIDNDPQTFKQTALDIAHELELNDKQDLALYIYAQFGLTNTFEITD